MQLYDLAFERYHLFRAIHLKMKALNSSSPSQVPSQKLKLLGHRQMQARVSMRAKQVVTPSLLVRRIQMGERIQGMNLQRLSKTVIRNDNGQMGHLVKQLWSCQGIVLWRI